MYIKIKLSTFLEILYFINDWLRLMGFGEEFNKLSLIVRHLADEKCFYGLSQSQLNKFYYIQQVGKEFARLDKIEGNEKCTKN